MSKNNKKAGIIAGAVIGAGLAIGAATTGAVLSNRPVDVTYYANNGTPEISAQIKKGDNSSLPTPTREGYNFAGWYLDTGLTQQVTSTTKLKQNSKLYAGWELANYEVATANAIYLQAETAGLKSIGQYAFANSKITSITIPDTVTSIGIGAFQNCTLLENLTMGNSVQIIDDIAFDGCSSLSSIELPDSVTYIGEYAFANCSSAISVTIGTDLQTLNHSMFANCTSLTSINFNATNCADLDDTVKAFYNVGTEGNGITLTFGDSVTRLPDNLFDCETSKIQNIVIGNAVSTIPSFMFSNYGWLSTLTIGAGVKNIGARAFDFCNNLTKINFNATACNELGDDNSPFLNAGTDSNGVELIIGNNVTKVPAYLFGTDDTDIAPKITDLTIGSNVKTIGDCAFTNCSTIDNVTIPSSVETIGDYAFFGCDLKSLTLNEGLISIGESAFCYMNNLSGNLVIPDTVETIGEMAFYGAQITQLTIGTGVKNIEGLAFNNCKKLTKMYFNATACNDLGESNLAFANAGVDGNGMPVIFGNNVTRVPARLFGTDDSEYAPKITKLTIGSNVKTIGDNAFSNCSFIGHITIPNSVTAVGNYAFENCSGALSISIGNGVANINETIFTGCYATQSLTIGVGVTRIDNFAFAGFRNLLTINFNAADCADCVEVNDIFNYAGWDTDGITVTFGNKVNKIPAWLFGGANDDETAKIKKLNIGSNVKTIGDGAFLTCDNLIDITIPDSVISIGRTAFRLCSGAKSLTIGAGLLRIYNLAFSECKRLERINFNATECEDFTSEFNGFLNCGIAGNGIDVAFGNNVTKIPTHLFWESSAKIKSVIIGNQVETIGDGAFAYCSELTNVTIGTGVTEIQSGAFYTCTALTSIYIPVNVQKMGTMGAAPFDYCSPSLKIRCEHTSAPSGFGYWDMGLNQTNITWGAKRLSNYTWQEIQSISQAGNAYEYFMIGEEKQLTLTDGTVITLQIADFNHDVDKYGNKIGITFVAKDVLFGDYTRNMNEASEDYQYGHNAGGWAESEMRAYLNTNIYNLLPSDLKSVITPAMKKSTAGDNSTQLGTTSEDKLFLLSRAEIGVDYLTDGYADEGTPYALLSCWAQNKHRVKYDTDGAARNWWLRSPNPANDYSFSYVSSSGSVTTTGAFATSRGICFAFGV